MSWTKITVSFTGRNNRCRVLNALMNHDGASLKFEHKTSNENPESMIFKLRDDTNIRLHCRLNYIRKQDACTIVRESCSKRGRLSKIIPFMVKASKNPFIVECGKDFIRRVITESPNMSTPTGSP